MYAKTGFGGTAGVSRPDMLATKEQRTQQSAVDLSALKVKLKDAFIEGKIDSRKFSELY